MSSTSSYTYLLITSRSGSLIYHIPLSPPPASLTTNDYLRIGSTLHSLKAITAQCSPVPQDGGMTTVDFGEGRMKVMQTETGMMFVLVAEQGTAGQEQVRKNCGEEKTRCRRSEEQGGVERVTTLLRSPLL